MKKLILPLVVVLVICTLSFGGAVFYLTNPNLQKKIYRVFYPSLCDNTLSYKIGRVDPEFGISRDEFRKNTAKGADIWNKASGENLFVYDSKALLSVNLVFDERQRLTNQINQLSNKISDSESELKPEIAQHQQNVRTFEEKMKDFNDRVKYWNDRGGAPEEDYNKLVSEQAELENTAEILNKRALELNQSAVRFNSQVSNYNDTISEFNSTLKERPEEGLFDGKKNTITIFFYISDPELVHTLSHEFGHSLGMSHVSNPEAVMFSKTNQNTTLTVDDLRELSKVCSRTPLWEILRDRYFQPGK